MSGWQPGQNDGVKSLSGGWGAEYVSQVEKQRTRRACLAEREATVKAVAEALRKDERKRERRCEACGSKRELPVCGEADRIVFGCRMGRVVIEPWPDYILRVFGVRDEDAKITA